MTGRLHRLLVTIAAIAAGLGGIIAMPEVEPLSIPREVGAWAALIAAIAMLVANTIRINYPVD